MKDSSIVADHARDPHSAGGGADGPTVFAAMWNHRLVVATWIAIFAALAVGVTVLSGHDYASRAGLLLEDPQPANASGSQPREDALRYVADQVAILKSSAVTDPASALLRARGNTSIDSRTLSHDLSVSSSENSNYVTVKISAADPDVSRAAANAVVQVYRQLTRDKIEADAAAARHRIEVAITAAETTAAETTGPSSTAQQQHAAALDLLDTLRGRLSDLEANMRLAGDGVAFAVPAPRGTKQGVSLPVALLIGLVLGGLIGVAVAYVLDSRRPVLTRVDAPGAILDVPALAEIPDLRANGAATAFPAVRSQRTLLADAFRFLAFELGLRRTVPRASHGSSVHPALKPADAATGVVAFVAPAPYAGVSTVVANTALAAAQGGRAVLAIDADLGGRGLTRLLATGDPETSADIVGFFDALAVDGNDDAMAVEGAAGTVSVLPPGTSPADVMGMVDVQNVLATLAPLARRFELVLVDVPPVPDVAYASALLRAAASVVVVVPHRSGAKELTSLKERLDLIGVRPIGYVYNFGARRPPVWRRVLRPAADPELARPGRRARGLAAATLTRLL